MKILINTPDIFLIGGVANHYYGLFPFWSAKVDYNYIGGRKGIAGPLILPFDYAKFVFLCLFGKYHVIILNPSLNKTAITRDALFLKIASLLNKKCLVFWHGWDKIEEEKINAKPTKFYRQFRKAMGFFVLSSEFETKLKQWGIDKPIWLTTTKVNDKLIEDFKIEDKKYDSFNLLYLARIEKEKGIFITLEAFEIILQTYPNCNLYVAGNGNASQEAKELVAKKNLKNVYFLGNISGNELIKVFTSSSVYILPTSHGEGMPTSVLEAMAFGLPVITRPVGGLVDFFENGKMGYMLESLEAADFVKPVEELLSNPQMMSEIGRYNHEYAKKHFMASQVAKSLESIFQDV